MPRAIWSGTISFGLVSIPVRMYPATESKELRFHFLHKDDLSPIGYDKVRKDTREHVVDLMEALREPVQRTKSSRAGRSNGSSARRKSAGAKKKTVGKRRPARKAS